MDAKFKKGDYIINRSAGDMAIIKDISKKGYYQFDVYYMEMTHSLYDLKKYKYELQKNYQKFWDFCNEKEKNKLSKIIKENEKTK